jgi:general secretion pathway protein A
MRCIQGKATLEDLRAWNRPALLRLADTDDKPHEVLLQSLDAETATLKLSDGPVRVPVTTLAPVWSGHVVVLWRLQTSLALIGRRSRGEPVLWLRSRLDMFDGEQTDEAPGATVFDEVLEARVKRFQSDQGLDVDGIVGARTMLLLNNLKLRPGTPTLSPGQGAG